VRRHGEQIEHVERRQPTRYVDLLPRKQNAVAEAQLRNAMSIGEGSAVVFFQRPMSIALVVIVVAVLVLPRLAKRMSERKLKRLAQLDA